MFAGTILQASIHMSSLSVSLSNGAKENTVLNIVCQIWCHVILSLHFSSSYCLFSILVLAMAASFKKTNQHIKDSLKENAFHRKNIKVQLGMGTVLSLTGLNQFGYG